MSFFFPLRPLLKGWLLSFLGWGLVALAMMTDGMTTRNDSWIEHLQPSLRDWLPWAVFTPLIFRLVTCLPLDRQRWRLAFPVHLLCCCVVIFMCHWWKATFNLYGRAGPPGGGKRAGAGRRGPGPEPGPPHGSRDDRDGPGDPPPGERDGPPPEFSRGDRPPSPPDGPFRGPLAGVGFDLLDFFSFQLPIYLMLLTGAHAALFFQREQERGASLAVARLDALRAQLQPHFLFNTLNTISGLIHDEPDKADALLTSLSELLRMSLETSKAHELPLGHDLDFVERYLDLMHGRFEERLLFTIDATPEARTALVPPMLLQPIVESAVEHGIQPKPAGGSVTVRAWRDGPTLRLVVADDGVGISRAAPLIEGVGLGNTRARLRELYGDRASLELRAKSGTEVEIALPFRTRTGAIDPAA